MRQARPRPGCSPRCGRQLPLSSAALLGGHLGLQAIACCGSGHPSCGLGLVERHRREVRRYWGHCRRGDERQAGAW